jgi:(R,R)-butanediol dehydrogenase / meso-butanediol dehydrogenase / diacetyl reductase
MKALRWHGPRDLRLVELVEPVLELGEVRISVAYCGICGSDLHEYLDGPHAIPVDCPHPVSGRRAPLTLGHEFCGTVVESADPVVLVGERVAVEPEYRCGHCDYCRQGQYNRCTDMGFIGLMGDGAFAETVVVPSYTVHPLPDEVSFAQAAALEPAAVALHAVRSSGLRAGDACAVFGMGPVGLLTVAMLRQCGAGEIIAIDIDANRLSLAAAMGASRVSDAMREDSASAVFAATSGRGAAIAFEVAGVQRSLDGTLACIRKGGEAILVGLMGKAQVDMFDIVNRELRLTGSVGYRDVFPTLIAWTAEGLVDPSTIVTRKVPLAQAVPDGFDALLADKGQVKVLVAPNGEKFK